MATTLQKNESKEIQAFKSALKFEIELPNGQTSQVITIFNGLEVNFEDLVKYMHCAFAEKTNHNIKSVVTTLGQLKDGSFQNVATYRKEIF